MLCCLLGALLSACSATGQEQPAAGLYAIDALVRSEQLPGIDLHVRYAERQANGLMLHLALYNNGAADLAQVQGANVDAARLGGLAPVAYSPSFGAGIAPAGGWLAGGATSGSLTFPWLPAETFLFAFPGFPPVPFRLDIPLREVPDAPALPGSAALRYDFQTASLRTDERVLVVEGLAVKPDALTVTVAVFQDRVAQSFEELQGALADAVLFDGRWSAYRADVIPADDESGDQQRDTAQAVLWFPRPAAGGTLLLRLADFPLIRLPTREQARAALATIADLPPSSAPRAALLVPPPIAQEPARQTDLQAFFAALNQSLAAGARADYLDFFVPELRDEQAADFDLIQTLPITAVTFLPQDPEAAIPVPEAGASTSLDATWSYGVRAGEQIEPFTSAVRLSLRRDGGEWRVAGIEGNMPFWAFGPTAAERAGAFSIFFRPAARPQLPTIRDETTAAIKRIDQALPGRARATNVMFVTETREEFLALTGRDAARFLGLALSRYRITPDAITTTEAAFYLNGAAFRASTTQNRQQTMIHELTHLVLAPKTMPFTPVWVVEGMAMQVAADLPAATMRAAYRTGAVEAWRLDDFTRLSAFGLHDPSGRQTALEYAFAAYLTRYLVETYGFERLLAFYDSFADPPAAVVDDARLRVDRPAAAGQTMGDLAAELTPERLATAFGIDAATLEADFLRWLPTQLD